MYKLIGQVSKAQLSIIERKNYKIINNQNKIKYFFLNLDNNLI